MPVLLCSYRPNNIYPGCGADVTEEILQQVPRSVVYCQTAQDVFIVTTQLQESR